MNQHPSHLECNNITIIINQSVQTKSEKESLQHGTNVSIIINKPNQTSSDNNSIVKVTKCENDIQPISETNKEIESISDTNNDEEILFRILFEQIY